LKWIKLTLDDGFTIAQIKRVSYNHGKEKLMFPYLQAGAMKYKRHILLLATSRNLWEEYERMRSFSIPKSKREEGQMR